MGRNLEKAGISWHPAFCGAMEMVLVSDKQLFEFLREYPLSKEPLRMDLLIIKKLSETKPVQNEIARRFKKYNIVEYKSPDDELSIDDFYKTIGYACLYKGLGDSVNQIPAKELTVSLFRDRYPRSLFQALEQEGFEIKEESEGIYSIQGVIPFDTQIIVTSRLKGDTHRSLRLLSRHIREEDVKAFAEEVMRMKDPGDRNNAEAVLQASIAANRDLYEEIRRRDRMVDALRDLFKEDIDAEMKLARQKGMQEGIREGIREGRKEGQQETLLETIRNLMANMKWTEDQAMSAMSIPADHWGFYKERL